MLFGVNFLVTIFLVKLTPIQGDNEVELTKAFFRRGAVAQSVERPSNVPVWSSSTHAGSKHANAAA